MADRRRSIGGWRRRRRGSRSSMHWSTLTASTMALFVRQTPHPLRPRLLARRRRTPRPAGASSATATQFEKDSQREMKAFWLPSKAPEAAHRLPKPPTDTVCPATGKRLRLKDLIPVKFTPLPDADRDRLTSRPAGWLRHPRESTGRFMCCVSHDVLTNAQQCVLLRPTGDVMLESVYNRVVGDLTERASVVAASVKPEGRYNGVKIRDKDVIKLRKGGTGFAAGGAQVESKKFYHLGHGSGLQEQRGEHRGPRSAFGLSIR
eukprot:scaffold1875_cov339-Prasinococcus_capsulatus_cf.AAC.22